MCSKFSQIMEYLTELIFILSNCIEGHQIETNPENHSTEAFIGEQ